MRRWRTSTPTRRRSRSLPASCACPRPTSRARVEANVAQLREIGAKRKAAKAAAVSAELPENIDGIIVDAGYPVVVFRHDGADAGGMRNFWDVLRSRLPKACACVLASNNDGTPILMAAGTDDAVAPASTPVPSSSRSPARSRAAAAESRRWPRQAARTSQASMPRSTLPARFWRSRRTGEDHGPRHRRRAMWDRDQRPC